MSVLEERLLSQRGIIRIETPNPYSAATTNCYFIDGDTPTLIDTALATAEAYDAIAAGLSGVGRSVDEIRRIILTHGHADHRALAPRICEESGAEVFCHPLETGKVVAVLGGEDDSRRRGNSDFFRSLDVPKEDLPRLVDAPKNPMVAPRPASASFLDDGDRIALDDYALTVLHTPGHSSGSLCLFDEETGILFAGDTILSGSHITALLEVEMIGKDPSYNGLKLHFESLRRLIKLGASMVLPGHGGAFAEYESIVETLLERHSKRRRHILRSLRNGRRTLYQICRSTFPFIPPEDLYLALSEVVGNIGILADEGKLIAEPEGAIIYYEKT